jgi:Ca-activated chloride channel family protein
MIEFAWPWLALLWPLPLLIRWLAPHQPPRFSRLWLPHIPTQSTQFGFHNRAAWPLALALCIWTAAVIAMMRPQWLGEPVPIQNQAREMFIAVDLSVSMEIADMRINGRQVDRLTMVKHVLSNFIARRSGDRLGLILFADTAYVQAPMTYDRNTVQQLLDEAVLRLIGERTAIGDAIALSVKRFREREQSNNILVLLTDGQNTAGSVSPQQALELAKFYGVKIYAIGVGADEIVVDGFFGPRRVNPSRDLDEDMLRSLAEQTGGAYFRARNTEELEQIYQTLDDYEPVAGEQQLLRPQRSLFHWPAGFALLLAALWLVAAQRPLRSSLLRGTNG